MRVNLKRIGSQMSNTLFVARKEFSYLLNSRLIIFIMAWYMAIFFLSFYGTAQSVNSLGISDPVQNYFVDYVYTLCYYGTLVAVVLGFSSISVETSGKALNTLLSKPLYRDTIINGKLLGAGGFMVCIYLLVTILYVSGISLATNGSRNAVMAFVGGLSLSFLLYMLCMLFFFSISMLACLLFREQSLALFMGFLAWIVLFRLISSDIFAGSISYFFGNSQSILLLVSGMSPSTMLYFILENMDLQSVLAESGLEVFKLFLYCTIGLILSYIAFLRRDVS